jgi:subtilisin family serine protease
VARDGAQPDAIRIGVLDSGVAAEQVLVIDQAAFAAGRGADVVRCALDTGNLGHGTAVACTILQRAPGSLLFSAQVFRSGRPGTPGIVAAGLEWLVESGARIVNMSFGLRHDRQVLRDACSKALSRGVLLVASVPARGPVVYPAAYPGVFRVTGDARCAPGDLSWLGSGGADFGACVGGSGHRPHAAGAGASLAAAHLSGELARALPAFEGNDEVLVRLRERCRYVGREQRSAS